MTKVIAHKLLGLDIAALSAKSIIQGTSFTEAGIHGVVDSDIFDWLIEANGEYIVEDLARRLQHFDFSLVEHDLLKYLYEGVISAETRKQLGEYYTPDWLAELVVNEAITDSLNQRVLDPSCGSGTFVFHAVRKYIDSASKLGISPTEYMKSVQNHVFGMDLHPVAVQLAKVTWLLALGEKNLTYPSRPELHAPISLGDSVQWRTGWSSIVGKSFNITIEKGDGLFSPDKSLTFPVSLLDDLPIFERLLDQMQRAAIGRRPGDSHPKVKPILQYLDIPPEYDEEIQTSMNLLCELQDEGRNHIWAYFIRNQARPAHFRRNPVDVVVGNPPWLSYRFMQPEMQLAFKDSCGQMGIWDGGAVATQQDLSAYFMVRSADYYLREGGAIAMVMPFSVLSRRQYAGFRTGSYGAVNLRFESSWSLKDVEPLFPIPAAVVFARKANKENKNLSHSLRMASGTVEFRGKLPLREMSLSAAKEGLLQSAGDVIQINDNNYASPYADRARNGATIYPRLFFFVEQLPLGPLGASGNKERVRSKRTSDEKSPWKGLPGQEGFIEKQFLFRICLGETILPFRIWRPRLAALPLDLNSGELYTAKLARLKGFTGLSTWLEWAESNWENLRRGSNLSLSEYSNYQSKLTAQLPLRTHRFVYPMSGSNLYGANVFDQSMIVDCKAYWIEVSPHEGDFLSAIFNSANFLKKVSVFQSVGIQGTRDFQKNVFRVAIPPFDERNDFHAEIAKWGAYGREIAESVEIPEAASSQQARRLVRDELNKSGVTSQLDELVIKLLTRTKLP